MFVLYCSILSQLIIDFYNETYRERYDADMSEETLTMLWSLTTALFLPGGMIGSLLGGWLADSIGRYCPLLSPQGRNAIASALMFLCLSVAYLGFWKGDQGLIAKGARVEGWMGAGGVSPSPWV